MKILITGASGFIGGRLLSYLADIPNVAVRGVGRRPLPHSPHYRALALERLDELDFSPQVVIHAAGRASPWGTAQDYYRDNVETTQQVIAFCRRKGLPRLILLSSAAVYYRFAHQYALREDTPVGPPFTSEYGRSKYLAEQVLADYVGEKTVLRPCGIFGAGDTLLFPPLITAARKRQLVRLRAENIPARTDLLHVDVLCDYVWRAANHAPLQPCYNLTANASMEIETLLDEVLTQMALPLPQRTMGVATALRFAGVMERLWRWLPLRGAPPITRFGVGVFGYSATLDVTRMLADFGPPGRTFSATLSAFLHQQERQK
ncbi:NAD(P)-dependent oxidoreductase [Kosakonia sp.]|uniref:NAD-dependent epimerase/dehydratase family protein n=1 Tax=Kosakonia sp. TaxID=1916651 RepID=UPI0028A07D2A|nr:NAD(P)-dependent oxidoreductase [Kosakonia sp.]